jgi:hypothetical protein
MPADKYAPSPRQREVLLELAAEWERMAAHIERVDHEACAD